MDLRQQKYLIIALLILCNSSLISTFIIYDNAWYVYLFILGLASTLSASSSILNLVYRMSHPAPTFGNYRLEGKKYLYVVPCYNESLEELTNSIHSLIEQRVVSGDERLLFIICDGKVKGQGNKFTTDVLLKKLLQLDDGDGAFYHYVTWNETINTVGLYKTTYTYKKSTMPIILLVKERNVGKRDSLVLVRQVCLAFNKYPQNYILNTFTNGGLLHALMSEFGNTFSGRLDFLIGIDGDTMFDYNCTYELIQGIEENANIHGCVGFVDVYPAMPKFSFFVMYQYAEYMFAQCLKRQAQSNITKKVNCLSGCNQILRVSEETCGDAILSVFNYCPHENDNIFTQIRSYASEDRNHVCNMLSMYPHVQTTQNLKAVAYTIVPTSIAVFLSQRKRWNLGATCNDILLIYLPGINIWERISALVSVLTMSVTPFIFVVTIHFVIAIINHPTLLMLYLSIILFVPVFYSILIPLFIKPIPFTQSLYYYLCYLLFVLCAGFVSLTTFSYALFHMNDIHWGKTRQLDDEEEDEEEKEEKGFIDDEYLEIIQTDHVTPSATTSADAAAATAAAATDHYYSTVEYKACTINIDDYIIPYNKI